MLAPVLALGFDGAVASAGGFVFTNDKILYDCPMTAEQYRTAMDLLGKEGVFRTVETRDGSYCDENLGDFLSSMGPGNSELERWRVALEKELNIRPLSEYNGDPVYKLVLMFTRPDTWARKPYKQDNIIVSYFTVLACIWDSLTSNRKQRRKNKKTRVDFLQIYKSE